MLKHLFILLAVLFSGLANAELTSPPKGFENQYLFEKNRIYNGGFEHGEQGWSSAIAITTSSGEIKEGTRGASWDPASSGTISSPGWATKAATAGYAYANCWYKSTDADYDFQVYNGSTAVEVSAPASATNFALISLKFAYAASTTYTIRFEAQGDESIIYIDDCWISDIGGSPSTSPTVQKFLTGSSTYTTPPGVKWIYVELHGGGGGGGGSGTASGGTGGTGGNSTFGTTLLVANGGTGGAFYSTGGVGGTASLGTGPIGEAITGQYGHGATVITGAVAVQIAGGIGGGSGGGAEGRYNSAGQAGTTNTGGGGQGGGSNTGSAAAGPGSGGGEGGKVRAIIQNPDASYSVVIGAGGTAGTAGTSGLAGGAGAEGKAIVWEHY